MDINTLCSPSDRSPPVKPPHSMALKRTRSQYQDEQYSPQSIRLPSFGELLSNTNSSPVRPTILDHQHAYSPSASSTPVSRLPSLQHQYYPTPVSNESIALSRQVSNESNVRTAAPRYQYDCDQIRARIAHYLESGEVKVTQFQRLLDINSNSYGRFMKHRGPDSGVDNQTYAAAHAFFVRQDMYGTAPPPTMGGLVGTFPSAAAPSPPIVTPSFTPINNGKKRQRTSTISSVSSRRTSGDVLASSASSVNGNDTAGPADITIILLPNLLTDSVPVHDSCDEIRRKITLHLNRAGVTQASFLRTLAAQFHAEERKFQSKQLNTFRSYRGADKGNTSAIFYAAYVYFERLRIKEGLEKTRHRIAMEAAWPKGFEIKTPGPSQRG